VGGFVSHRCSQVTIRRFNHQIVINPRMAGFFSAQTDEYKIVAMPIASQALRVSPADLWYGLTIETGFPNFQ
jgi:hypothetical protein